MACAVLGLLAASTLLGTLVLTRLPPVPPPGAVAEVLRPALVVGALVTVAALVSAFATDRWWRGVAVVVGAALAVVGALMIRPDLRTESPHREPAAWIGAVTAPTTTLVAPPGVRSDLLRDGVAADRLRPDGELLIRAGPDRLAADGGGLARFGAGPGQLGVAAAASWPATRAAPRRTTSVTRSRRVAPTPVPW